ncbi:MAG TPA: PGPGW domain-containing protein [Blastocatellia bacterium]|nr:PGPGW domain-containing protein [Blastocatellia bacterium]
MGTKARLKRGAVYLVGWGFILLGILGLFLPILQGILFILVGLLFLSSVSPWAARLLHRLAHRFPRISRQLEEAKARAIRFQAKLGEKLEQTKSNARNAHRKVFTRGRQRGKPKEEAES